MTFGVGAFFLRVRRVLVRVVKDAPRRGPGRGAGRRPRRHRGDSRRGGASGGPCLPGRPQVEAHS